MNKNTFIKNLSNLTNLSVKDSKKFLNIVLLLLTETLKKEETVNFRDFGAFKIVSHRSYIGKNPYTGEQLRVPPKKVPKFRPAKQLRNMIKDI